MNRFDPAAACAIGFAIGCIARTVFDVVMVFVIDRFFTIEPLTDHVTKPPPFEVGDHPSEHR